MKYLVVGAGFAGATVSRMLADLGHNITVIDQRNHIGGNAYDYLNEHRIRVHKYGPHLFHTSNKKVYDWLSGFTEWIPFEHHILALLADGSYVPWPANLNTLDQVPESKYTETFIVPYSTKMWGKYFEQLDPEVIARVKINRDRDNKCFRDDYQVVPSRGYEAMFAKIFDSSRIKVNLETPFDKSMELEFDHVFNSMAIDDYYDQCYGLLPYRSIKFHHHSLPLPKIHPSPTVNFTNDSPYTRSTEWKNIAGHGDNPFWTSITVEEPCDPAEVNNEKYYPVLTKANKELYNKYRAIVNDKVTFIGRCGNYVYLDMHQAISSAMSTVEYFLKNLHR